MGSREVTGALRASWWLVVTFLLLGAGAGIALSLLLPHQYTAGTQLFVSTTQSASTSDAFTGSQFSQQRVASYARLLTGERLAKRVIGSLGLAITPRQLTSELTVTAEPDTVLLDVTVTDRSPERARDIADSIDAEFPDLVTELEAPSADATTPVRVTVVDDPELPLVPSEPRPVLDIALGALAGLALGVLAATARARLDRSVRDPEDAAAVAGAPVVGTILRDSQLARRHVTDASASSRSAEDYRQLRTNLQFLSIDDPARLIMISSALPNEGKTTMAINLALALAQADRRVALVEADLRRPRITQYLRLVGGVGLTNVLAGTADLDEVMQPSGSPGVSVLGAGPTPPNPGELLASSHMSAVLGKLRAAYDYVIVDAPPLLPVADAAGLAALTDGVLLAVRFGKTRKDQLRLAAQTLERVRARLLGLALNIVPPKDSATGTYGYDYDVAGDRR